ncbi:MAG: enoyl-CoA hydratase-related protein [Myxococcota bacterium]|jgi:enoyl-CoA hydratase/carnithine racemase|nr:enoyl-CoA hydratase-related protein [Myxococcota bacterium]
MAESQASTSVVLCEIERGVAELTLNRPERMNAFTPQMGADLVRLFGELDRDDAVRAIVVTGAGRAFCAGADLGGGEATFKASGDSSTGNSSADDDEVLPKEARVREIRPWLIEKPIIGAIQGHAVGLGLTLALQWDIRIVADDAKLSFAFVQRGVVTELASTWILPRLVGLARASDLLMTGRTFRGKEAAELGVANEALPADAVLPRAREIARAIVERCAPASVALTKRMIWQHLALDDPYLASQREATGLARLGRMPDAAEGVKAFLQKRAPQWQLSAADAPQLD